MARDYILRIRLTNEERQKILAVAEQRGVSIAEVVRDLIKALKVAR